MLLETRGDYEFADSLTQSLSGLAQAVGGLKEAVQAMQGPVENTPGQRVLIPLPDGRTLVAEQDAEYPALSVSLMYPDGRRTRFAYISIDGAAQGPYIAYGPDADAGETNEL